jgi:hypothetical protein
LNAWTLDHTLASSALLVTQHVDGRMVGIVGMVVSFLPTIAPIPTIRHKTQQWSMVVLM